MIFQLTGPFHQLLLIDSPMILSYRCGFILKIFNLRKEQSRRDALESNLLHHGEGPGRF